jgi:hypothetical protein
VTTKHYRKPEDATTLPLATEQEIAAWFAEVKARGLAITESEQPAERQAVAHA